LPGDGFFQPGVRSGFEALETNVNGVPGDQLDEGNVGVPETGLDIPAKPVVNARPIGDDQVYRAGLEYIDRLLVIFGKKNIGYASEVDGQLIPFRSVGEHEE
jgi:hypothetical protein